MEVLCTKLDSSAGLDMWNIPAVALLCLSTMKVKKKILQTNFIIAAFIWDMKAQ